MAEPKKVAIVHDWLVGGGAELVVEQLHELYPDAPIYTSYCTDEWRKRLDNKVITGWLQPLGKIRKLIPFLRIIWFTNLKLDEYDLVISSSGAEAKGIKFAQDRNRVSKWLAGLGGRENRKGAVPTSTVTANRSEQQSHASQSLDGVSSSADEQVGTVRKPIHVNYCHAPTHYYWSRYDEYLKRPGFGKLDWLARIGLKLLVAPLRKWDLRAAQRPDYIIANSTHIQREIKKYYGRESTVIHPPVYFERFQKPEHQTKDRKGFLIAGRQTPYKRFDLAIQACTELNLPLTVVGDGPDNARLRSLAGPTVTFLGYATAEEVESAFASAEAFLFPGLDDFGITPVEAMAAGTPVIAYKAGGALDYIIPGKTGEFFVEQTTKSLQQTLKNFNARDYDHKLIRAHSQKFSKETFQNKFKEYIRSIS